MKTYALLSTPEGRRYGHILSTHRTKQAAQTALNREARAVRRRHPDALTGIMYEITELPTPAGGNGKVGDRIAIDLSRS